MNLPRVLANGDLKHVKIVLAAALVIVAIVGFARTDIGARTFSQLGIKNSIAQTVGAAQIALQKTGDALNSFIGRSPGERGATDVLKGKAKRLALRDGKVGDPIPTQRALGKIFDNPVRGLTEPAILPPVVAFLPDGTTTASGPIAALTPVASIGPGISPSVIGSGPGGGGFIIGGGGGGPGGGTVVAPPTVPVIASAVPEPSTWLLLLLGFGTIGASLRRGNADGSSISRRAGHCAKN